MQVVKTLELFKDFKNIYNIEFEKSNNINLDFSNVDTIDLKSIKILLDIQKAALLNNKTLSIINASPEVKRVLEITGLVKTFANAASNPIKRKNM